MKQRKKRMNAEAELTCNRPETANDCVAEAGDKVEFMEEVNYRMDFKDSGRPSQLVLLKSQETIDE